MQRIKFGEIKLRWSKWVSWKSLEIDGLQDGSSKIPNKEPGVYEVRIVKSGRERLTIGKASNLRRRIIRALIEGKSPHSAGKRIRANENLNRLEVRWAKTTRPAEVEEELHQKYKKKFKRLPKYVKVT